MRFSFGCPAGFHIEAGSIFDKLAIRRAMTLVFDHVARCPYCTFKVDALTHRRDVG